MKGDFNEADHPRADDGKFGEGSGSGSTKPEPAESKKPSGKSPLSKAKVTADNGKEEVVAALSKDLLGEPAQHVASLVGAPDDAEVHLSPTTDGKGLSISIKGSGFKARRYLRRDKDGKLFIKNDIFEVDEDKQGSGIGSEIFSRQVQTASAMGVSYLVCEAAGRPGDKMNGYYTWPRMGYDAPIASIENAVKIKKQFPEAKTLLDVMASEEGRDWWKANGLDIEKATFDLTSDSRSMKIHAAYMAERAGRK